MKRLTLPALALTALSGCLDTMQPATPVGDDPCNAAQLNDDIGKSVGDLELTVTGAVRAIRPGDPVTMDYSPTRLNIDLDENDRVVRAWCG